MGWIEDAINNLVTKSEGEINSRLQEICFDIDIADTKAKGHCYFVKLDGQGNPRTNDLIEFVTNKIVDYSIPRKEIDDAREYFNKNHSTLKIVELQRKATLLFTDLEKTGEGGKILLYALTQEFLKLPQLLSKMSLKTSGQLHYQGADGIHVGYNSSEDSLSLYWGESKMYKDLNTGVKECLKGIKGYLLDTYSFNSTQERDLQLITSNIKTNVNDERFEDLLVRYFDKDDDLSNNLTYKGICFVGFDSTNYPEKPMQKTVDELRIAFASEFDNWFKNITSRIGKYANLELYEIHFFLIPFPSVENFRKHFLETLKK